MSLLWEVASDAKVVCTIITVDATYNWARCHKPEDNNQQSQQSELFWAFIISLCWLRLWFNCCESQLVVHRVRKKSMPKFREKLGGTKTMIYCQATVCRRCVLATLRIIRLGLTKVGNQTKPLKYSEKRCISYQFRAGVRTYGHRPRWTADNDAVETWRVRSKMPDFLWWLLLPQQYAQSDRLQSQLATCQSEM